MSSGDPAPQNASDSSDDSVEQTNPEVMGSTAAGSAGGAPSDTEQPQAAASTGPAPKIGRSSGPLAARGQGIAKPSSPSVSTEDLDKASQDTGKRNKKSNSKKAPRPRLGGEKPASQDEAIKPAVARHQPAKVPVPSRRRDLDDDLQAELDAQLAAADIETMLSGNAGMPDRAEGLTEGARIQGTVLKIHGDSVFVALGGPDEGVVAFEQFTTEPEIGQIIEVLVRSFNQADGLYSLGLPGAAVEASDWEDIDEGTVVDALVTAANTGGLECKVGNMKGFIPISQIADYRVEDTSEFVDQKFLCVVTESNERRGNLVLSRRAVLEREREENRQKQLEEIEVGYECEGTVRSLKDFGAFVDLGALDGLIHISKLSWERVKHPSEVLEVGQKVKVRIEKLDKETGKISLSYRDLLENPWDTAETDFAVGSVVKGTVTRTAPFGCFIKLGPGIEGLAHISELAHHRVSKVEAFINEGDEVEAKVISFDRDTQKIGLSIKQAQSIGVESSAPAEEEVIEPPREPAVKATHTGPLRGGNNRESGGERFGLRW